MANLFKQLNKLKTNIFGGPGNTGFTKPPASRVQDINMLENTPTDTLFQDPLSVSTFSYPMDVQQNFQNGHYMLFYINVQDKTKYQYQSADGVDIGDYQERAIGVDKFGNKIIAKGKGANSAEVAYQKNRAMKSGKHLQGDKFLESGELSRNAKKGVTSLFNNTRRIQESIALYLPPNVADSTSAQYEDTPTGILGVAATDIIRGVKAFNEDDFELIGSLGGKALKETFQEILKNLGGGAVEALTGNEGAIPLANKVFGRADNPFVEVFFKDMAVRTFQYNFNFAPRNEEETMEIQQIIQLFRFHMAPELQERNSRYLTLPSEFDIHYMYKAADGNSYENDYYNRIGTCVLENVATNYTPNGVKSFADGAPTQITMSLSFRETETLTKEKINQGY